MSGYLSSRKLGNVRGRIQYITDEKKQENIVDYYDTADSDFWDLLATESRERHEETKAGGKCCEARELIIAIPQKCEITARELCETFKNKYDVECACSIHQNDKEGVINRHCHLIFSERKRLSIPEITEERRATRTYYYDEKGHKCPKTEAKKIVAKGTILQKGTTRYFLDKDEYFKSPKFVVECKELFLKNTLKLDWSLRADKQNKELAEQHIGKNNPKAEYIRQNNKLKQIVKNVCNAGDFMLRKEDGYTYEMFKKYHNVISFKTPYCKENQSKVYTFVDEMQAEYKTIVKDEVRLHNEINSDVDILEDDFYGVFVQRRVIETYEPKTKTTNKPNVIEYLKSKLEDMVVRIKKLVKIQDMLYIEPKDQISIEQDKRNDKLYIIDENYMKEQEQKQQEKDKDYDLEF